MLNIKCYAVTCLLISLIVSVVSDCPFPKKKLTNGWYVYESPQHVNLTTAWENYLLRFHCSPGFTMRGSKALVCISDQWTDKVPTCLKMRCANPPEVPKASYTMYSGPNRPLTIGTTATYTCDPGYELENFTDSVLTCTLYSDINAVQWKGATPSCIVKETCPDPGVSPDGKRSGTCCFIRDVLEFSCNDRFELVGQNKIECLPGGSWSAPRSLCRPEGDHCESPSTIPHGATKGDKEGDYYRPYDEVEVICQPGYRYNGSTDFIMCEEETGWEEEFEECVEAFCDPPPPLANGTIPEIESSNMTAYPYNFEITYICDKGFRLIGDSWRFCDSRGWSVPESRKSPTCEEIHCPDPGVPEHGTRIGNSFKIGDKVTFKCFTGYDLIGSFERYCMPNGQWSNELARCDHSNNYCPDPGIPVNGGKNSSSYDMGAKIGFSCYGGYTLIGSEDRECLPNRQWSGEEAKCLGPYDFDNSAKISDILKEAIARKEAEQKRKLKEYHEAMYEIWHNGTKVLRLGRVLDVNFPGRLIFYFVFDVSGSVREVNFRKSVEFAKAIVKKVGVTEHGARVGALTFSSTVALQFLPLDYKTTEDVLGAFDRLNYTGGGTAASTALTYIRESLIPLTQKWISKKGGMKSIIFILTDGKANMGGDPKEQAELLKQAGVEIYCIGVTNSVQQNSLFKIATDPEHVFILQNYATLSFLVEEITNGTIDYSKCGLGSEKIVSQGRIAGGGQATDPWPWMAALYFVTPGLQPEFKCGGSIIHDSFILTAAHCLFKKDAEVEEKEIIVKLGLTDVKNQSTLQEFEVTNIITHPLYRTGLNFDYDIALLQLRRPIKYTALIRPICLPLRELSLDANFYKSGEYAVAIGWGHTGIREPGMGEIIPVDQLKELILQIQPIERCRKALLDRNSFNESFFKERMFCAGDGKGGNDTCQGDSGGPLMQSQINEDGFTYWTQVGIVSWGIGCGLANTYGYYTHVQKLVDWITTKVPLKN